MARQKQIYNISAYHNFSDTLAKWMLKNYGQDPLQLSQTLMLLPSRRAATAMRDAFLRASDGKPLLLPHMQPIGEVDEDILIISGNAPLLDKLLPPQAFMIRRLFILTRLIMQRYTHFRIDHALKLARALAILFDELEREQTSLANIKKIVPDDFANHWQVTVDFLQIIAEHWPAIAAQENVVSPVSYRNETLLALAKEWKANPPNHPVIVAGTTGSIPASAELIATVAAMEKGIVVLPAFDATMDKDYLKNISESHSQWGMCRLLEKMGCDAEDAQELDGNEPMTNGKERTHLLSEVMRPAELSDSWQKLTLNVDKALVGLKNIACANRQEEAAVIALILREVLERPEKTGALITHDRDLARAVSATIQRFGVTIDDSAGIPLSKTPTAAFLRLIAEVATAGIEDSSIALLSLLKHPLAHAGMERIECLEAAREYELQILRASKALVHNLSDNVKTLQKNLKEIFTPFTQALRECVSPSISDMPELVKLHIACAEVLAAEDLWKGPEAESIAELLTDVQSIKMEKVRSPYSDYCCYAEMFDELLSAHVFRPEYGMHPRLKILSPMEARMQSFDVIVLGSLNEGSWPRDSRFDPWLNRKMRLDIGLASPEREMGLAAHDFFTLASADEVYLTRAEKVDGAPTTPARWLVKLDVLLSKFDKNNALQDIYWQGIAAKLDVPENDDVLSRPEPKPPLSARPKKLSVTQIETLMDNPYAIYASQVLRLKKLEPIMVELNGSDFGNAVHKALERFVKEYPAALPPEAHARLVEFGKEYLQPFFSNDRVKSLWWPRFLRIAEFVMELEQERRNETKRVIAEVSESHVIGDFTLMGRADRIEEYKDGINIVDYKTGILPARPDVESGRKSQLVLLGLIMEAKAAKVKSLEYWHLQGNASAGKILDFNDAETTKLINAAKDGLVELIEQYNNVDFPYLSTPIPPGKGRYNDYAHLARIKEWNG